MNLKHPLSSQQQVSSPPFTTYIQYVCCIVSVTFLHLNLFDMWLCHLAQCATYAAVTRNWNTHHLLTISFITFPQWTVMDTFHVRWITNSSHDNKKITVMYYVLRRSWLHQSTARLPSEIMSRVFYETFFTRKIPLSTCQLISTPVRHEIFSIILHQD